MAKWFKLSKVPASYSKSKPGCGIFFLFHKNIENTFNGGGPLARIMNVSRRDVRLPFHS